MSDAGAAASDLEAIEEAATIFAPLVEARPGDSGLKYNLANALASQTKLDRTPYPAWYLKTAVNRRRARSLLGEAAKLSRGSEAELASQMPTNLGNALDAAHRWIEAYECYAEGPTVNPTVKKNADQRIES